MRIDDNGRRRYFYTREQIQAYYKSKKDKEAAANDKNQNESSLQDTVKKAVSSAKGQLESLAEEAKKAATDTKAEIKSNTKPAQSSSPKPSTGVADYARRKAAEANSPKTKSAPISSEEDDDDSGSKKSTKSKESTKSETSSGSSGRRSSSGSSRGSAQQSAAVAQFPSAMVQQALDARKTANVSLTSMDEFDDTIAKVAKNLEGADKYEAYKRAVDAFKANPTRENALKRNQLKQEWLATPHGKYVSSLSSELKNKKQVSDSKMLLKNLTSVPKNNSTSSLVSLFLNNTRR